MAQSIQYSVMQSDGSSFCGDVVLDGFNMSYRDEDSILEQKYEKQISWDLYHEDFISGSDCRKCIFKEIQHVKTRS